MTPTIGIIDLGGQYCHLIARRFKDMGVPAVVLAPQTAREVWSDFAGLVFSGGPSSVYDPAAPSINDDMLQSGKPILGICYGHQLLVHRLGGRVEQGQGEYGPSSLLLAEQDTLFADLPVTQRVWMSHGDSVMRLPDGAMRLAGTASCRNAAFAMPTSRYYGVQFHPEVVHTQYGDAILRNFAEKICGIGEKSTPQPRVPEIEAAIRRQVGTRSVFFLVSGGVDSTVGFVLCARALPKERVLGLYVDTGLMRKGETDELHVNLRTLGLESRLLVRDESARFMEALEGVQDPEEKRQLIGRLFVEVQSDAMQELGIDRRNWVLGQGTIYPDTIESGGVGGQAAVIKTHHNRVAEIRELMEQGMVVEPLSDFYKDEVREIGIELGLASRLLNRWPFPGPGLAIRCICNAESADDSIKDFQLAGSEWRDFRVFGLRVRSVGVQGDGRTYRTVAAVAGPLEYDRLQKLSSQLCNETDEFNRVVCFVRGVSGLEGAKLVTASLDSDRLARVREADHVVRRLLAEEGLSEAIWQFPVILVPLQFAGGESVVLRPVNSADGMTASFARLPVELVQRMAREILRINGIDAVFLDVTDKPPATIEWE